MENQLKVAVELHEGEKSTKKIWRFNADEFVVPQASRIFSTCARMRVREGGGRKIRLASGLHGIIIIMRTIILCACIINMPAHA